MRRCCYGPGVDGLTWGTIDCSRTPRCAPASARSAPRRPPPGRRAGEHPRPKPAQGLGWLEHCLGWARCPPAAACRTRTAAPWRRRTTTMGRPPPGSAGAARRCCRSCRRGRSGRLREPFSADRSRSPRRVVARIAVGTADRHRGRQQPPDTAHRVEGWRIRSGRPLIGTRTPADRCRGTDNTNADIQSGAQLPWRVGQELRH
jgi:hypothetical protein